MAKQRTEIVDYELRDGEGPVKLSSLFGDHDQLVVLHNMGKSCPNCALWGDEFNGMLDKLERVTGFCIVGPDDPTTQADYASKRGWRSRICSADGTSFIKDLGFENEKGAAMPGVSVFEKSKGTVALVDQISVMKDNRCPSVLEVFWMLNGTETSKVAFG